MATVTIKDGSIIVEFGGWGLFGGPRQLVAVTRSQPGLHLLLDRAGGGEFDEIVVSVPAADRLASAVGTATGHPA